MDVLYTGDIPQDFIYADFNNYYIDLYNTNNFQPNSTYRYYRIYLYDNGFYYDTLTRTTSNYSYALEVTPVTVSNKISYRRDIDSIWSMLFISIFGIVVLFNIITSMVRKGGVLGGLL